MKNSFQFLTLSLSYVSGHSLKWIIFQLKTSYKGQFKKKSIFLYFKLIYVYIVVLVLSRVRIVTLFEHGHHFVSSFAIISNLKIIENEPKMLIKLY